jgi:uncharacterized protein YceH (UPF0502 family)
VDLDDVDIRVLGCLVEKQRTTPDQYPLTLNALRLACNQTTNRDPVVSYDEATVRDSVQGLGRRRLARLASGPGSRAPKYRHLLDEALGLDDAELALLAVLMLRGPQTPGELKARAERLHRFADLGSVEATLERLMERALAERLERRPGQKEVRYRQLLGGGGAARAAPATQPAAAPASPRSPIPLEQRIERLEAEVRALRSALDELRAR